MRVWGVWSSLLRRVSLFLAQSEEDARRLVAMGADDRAVRVVGNLKYDAAEPARSEIVQRLDMLRCGKRIVIAGSTLEGEELMLLSAWAKAPQTLPNVLLVIAPRHPQRFQDIAKLIGANGYATVLASDLAAMQGGIADNSVVQLNTIGDLAAAYQIADIAFVGGSLVPRGGHNPLEPARFGVPVLIGSSYENFRDIVGKMQEADGIRIVSGGEELQAAIVKLLQDEAVAHAIGERGRQVFEQQQGATARTVAALVELMNVRAAITGSGVVQ
jgi:3-deoxy-D-manno-octulosonic-acid transferase